MSEKLDIKQLAEDLNKVVSEVRTKSEDLEKKFDVIDLDSIKKMDTDISEIGEKLDAAATAAEGEKKAYEQQIETLEKHFAVVVAGIGGDKNSSAAKSDAQKAFSDMLRAKGGHNKNGEGPYTEGHLNEVAAEIIAKEFASDTEAEWIAKDLVFGNDGSGGYLAPTEFGGMIMGRIFETSPVRTVANVITMSAAEISFVLDDDEPDAGWVGEVDTRGDTDTPGVGQIVIPAHEVFAQPRATQKLLDDAGIDLESWLAGKVSRKFGRVENTAFVAGDGSQKPKGFLAYDAWAAAGVYERNAVEQIASGTSGSFDGDSFKTLQNAIIEDYQARAVWMMKRSTWANVTKLKDLNDRYLFEELSNFRDGDRMEILGKSVVLADDMPAQAADSLSVVYGDFTEGYSIADRIGIRILRDPFTSKPFIKFYTTKRVGAAVTNYEALKIMKLEA